MRAHLRACVTLAVHASFMGNRRTDPAPRCRLNCLVPRTGPQIPGPWEPGRQSTRWRSRPRVDVRWRNILSRAFRVAGGLSPQKSVVTSQRQDLYYVTCFRPSAVTTKSIELPLALVSGYREGMYTLSRKYVMKGSG